MAKFLLDYLISKNVFQYEIPGTPGTNALQKRIQSVLVLKHSKLQHVILRLERLGNTIF